MVVSYRVVFMLDQHRCWCYVLVTKVLCRGFVLKNFRRSGFVSLKSDLVGVGYMLVVVITNLILKLKHIGL